MAAGLALNPSSLERLERELCELLSTIRAYRGVTGDHASDVSAEASTEEGGTPPPSGLADIIIPSSRQPQATPSSIDLGDRSLGETGWLLIGDCWLLRAPDGYQLRLNICERALLLALAQATDHAISFDAFFQLMENTRVMYGQKPLALTSRRMILMRLMTKLGRSSSPGPLLSVHGWGYRLRVRDELQPAALHSDGPFFRSSLLGGRAQTSPAEKSDASS